MVTKAELEAEVAELRRQLAERPAPEDKQEETVSKSPDEPGAGIHAEFETWPDQLESALTELEDLPHKKPILFALGVFALGYLIGRSR